MGGERHRGAQDHSGSNGFALARGWLVRPDETHPRFGFEPVGVAFEYQDPGVIEPVDYGGVGAPVGVFRVGVHLLVASSTF
jgi:hypothetical protein